MKKSLITACILICLFAFKKSTDDKKITSADINNAINKSLPLLQGCSHTFLKNAAPMVLCHSCHNQGLGVVAFAMAKDNGFAVSDDTVNEAIDSTCSYWKRDANLQTLAENDDPTAIVMAGNYDLWGLASIHFASTKIIELLARNIMRKQTYNGNWISEGQRPPLEYYSFSATALTVKNIQSYIPAILHDEVKQRIAKARTWLINTKPEANEEKIFQLLGLTWCNADMKFIAHQAKKLLAAQHADGGWSQLDSLPTDAYATGQALYALNQSGQLKVTDAAYQNGIDFLLRTQEADGSWHVKTRSYPFVPYVNSGFPHGSDQFISAAGSNWATMALLLAVNNKVPDISK
jgi:N-acyl-D-amino-acid deacylase